MHKAIQREDRTRQKLLSRHMLGKDPFQVQMLRLNSLNCWNETSCKTRPTVLRGRTWPFSFLPYAFSFRQVRRDGRTCSSYRYCNLWYKKTRKACSHQRDGLPILRLEAGLEPLLVPRVFD